MATLKLGNLADALAGKSGNTVFYRSPAGTSFRDYQLPSNPNTAAQQQVRTGFKFASVEWNLLSPQEAEAWRAYALTLATREPGSGAIRAPRARSVFISLAAKLQQVNPQSPIPHTPPASHFFGDSVAVSASPVFEGGILFEADGPNRVGVLTELLVQRLRLGSSAPYRRAYRSEGFVSFSGEPVVSPQSPGWYAVAYRFVNATTGQVTGLAEMGVVQVT